MAVQTISGVDAVPQGALESSRVNLENARNGNEQQVRERSTEENKGTKIDTSA